MECSLLSRATVEGLGGSLWAIKTCLLARRGDVSDEELWGSQGGHWHLHMEGWTFSMTRGLHCGREPHPVREGTSLPTQLTSPENPFMISSKSIYLGWEVSHRTVGRKGTQVEKGSWGRDLWEAWAEAGIFLPNFLILCYFSCCPWKETDCH